MSIHVYDIEVARQCGVPAGLLLSYFSSLNLKKRSTQTGRSVRRSVSDFIAMYPYLTPDKIRFGLSALEESGFIERRKRCIGGDQSLEYTLLRPQTDKLFKFDSNHAVEFGLVEANIIHHFQGWIYQNKQGGLQSIEGHNWKYGRVADIAGQLPWSKSTVERALGRLLEKEVLIRRQFPLDVKYRRFSWAFADEERFVRPYTENQVKTPNGASIPQMQGADSQMAGHKTEMVHQNPKCSVKCQDGKSKDTLQTQANSAIMDRDSNKDRSMCLETGLGETIATGIRAIPQRLAATAETPSGSKPSEVGSAELNQLKDVTTQENETLTIEQAQSKQPAKPDDARSQFLRSLQKDVPFPNRPNLKRSFRRPYVPTEEEIIKPDENIAASLETSDQIKYDAPVDGSSSAFKVSEFSRKAGMLDWPMAKETPATVRRSYRDCFEFVFGFSPLDCLESAEKVINIAHPLGISARNYILISMLWHKVSDQRQKAFSSDGEIYFWRRLIRSNTSIVVTGVVQNTKRGYQTCGPEPVIRSFLQNEFKPKDPRVIGFLSRDGSEPWPEHIIQPIPQCLGPTTRTDFQKFWRQMYREFFEHPYVGDANADCRALESLPEDIAYVGEFVRRITRKWEQGYTKLSTISVVMSRREELMEDYDPD